MRAASFSLVLWHCVSVPVLSCCRATVRVHAFVCELHSRMPSHDSSFVNTPLLLLPSTLPFHLCALSLWMTAWLQSSRSPRPNLLYVLPQSPLLQQLPVVAGVHNKYGELRARWEFSYPIWVSIEQEVHNITLTE